MSTSLFVRINIMYNFIIVTKTKIHMIICLYLSILQLQQKYFNRVVFKLMNLKMNNLTISISVAH